MTHTHGTVRLRTRHSHTTRGIVCVQLNIHRYLSMITLQTAAAAAAAATAAAVADADFLSPTKKKKRNCTDAEPYTQPSFTLTLGGNGAQFSETISLYVAGVEEISWGSLSSNTFETDEEKLIQIMATNTGNIPFNHRLEVSSEDDWDVELDANDIVDLQVGESVLVRIKVTANEPPNIIRKK